MYLTTHTAGDVATELDFLTVARVDGTQICAGGRGCYSGPGGTVCAVITGNSIADIELDQNDAYTIQLPGYTGGPGDVGAVESFLAGNNDGGGAPTAVAAVSGSGGGFVGASSC
jgi:hypothetical protein